MRRLKLGMRMGVYIYMLLSISVDTSGDGALDDGEGAAF